MNNKKVIMDELLKNSIIIDSLSHGPIVWTDDLVAICHDMLSKNIDPWRIVQDIILKFAEKIVTDYNYFKEYHKAWEDSRVSCISWTVGPIYEKPYTFDGILHNLSFLTHILDNKREYFQKIMTAEDIINAHKEKKKGIIINLQNLEPIGTNLDLIETFYMMGIRIMQLTLNTKNLIGTGCLMKRDRGLTDFGKQVIEKMNQKGIIIDISHCGSQTSKDTIEYSKDPIMATHTSAKNLYNHPRGKDDDLLKAIAERGGYIGVFTIQGFISNKLIPTIEDWINHIDYIVNLIGVDYVGIGTDFYGHSIPHELAVKLDQMLSKLGMSPEHGGGFQYKMKDFEDYIKFPNLIEALLDKGYSTQEVKKIAGENFLRVFKKVVG